MRLEGKVAIVTGGAQGIGGACASRLAAEGAALVVVDIHEAILTAKVDEIEAAGGQALGIRCDVSDQAQVDAMLEQTIATYGRVDILINNAALVHHPPSNVNFLELPADAWQRALDINLSGAFFCAQGAARIMVRQITAGTATGGCIINMSSGGASRAHRQLFNYDTTKGGIEAATRAMALDLAPWQIRVNAIVPGNIAVANSMGGAIGPEAAQGTIPLGHPGTPADIAAAAAFLATDDARYITGSRLFVDGGMDAQLRSPGVDTPIDRDRLSTP